MKQLSQIYLFLLLVTMLSGCTTFGYYTQAVTGHLSLMMGGEPVQALVRNPDTPADLRQRLATAEAARTFAAERLALPVGDAFTDYVALDRPWVMVNVVATPEFSLEPHRWCYPVLGCQAYRGYFDLEDARAEQARFEARGFDTFVGGVTAYSTLGWFDDPLHSGFTRLPEARMVALMFHELAHRVVYIGDDTAFNESFATAVELEGLRLWLEEQGQPDQFAEALDRIRRRNQTLTLVEHTTAQLAALYARRDTLPEDTLRARKAEIFAELEQRYQEKVADWPEPGPFGPPPVALNNAHLALFRQYNQYLPAFRQLLRESGGRFADFYERVKALSGQPPELRAQQLAALSERFDEHL